MFYLVDGALHKSLGTKVKRYAQALLDQYHAGKYGLGPKITVGEYYEKWIQTKTPPLVRASLVRDYRHHFMTYILPALQSISLNTLSISLLSSFRAEMLESSLSIKTARNVIDSSFRAMWRDAMIEGVVTSNPFALLRWPRFTAEERDQILDNFQERLTTELLRFGRKAING